MDTNNSSDSSNELDPPAAADEARPRGGRAAEIRAALQEDIESGKLAPGDTLDERALAERFQVSRTPVREALQQLAALDLVRIAPRQGVSVARLSIGKLRAIMEAIGELEAACAKLAARRVDEPLRRRLDDALARCQDAAVNGGAAEYALANSIFHEAVYAGSRNEYLSDQIRVARRLVQRYRPRDFQNPAQINKSLQDHLKIVRAIQSGDEALAAQAMALHVPAGSTGFSEFLAAVPASFFETDAGGG